MIIVRTRTGFQIVAVSLLALTLAGCDPRDCWLGIAHQDCDVPGSSLAMFPQDDAVCRGYGLRPGTHDYDVCRSKKGHERLLTDRETDYGVLQNPLTPNLDTTPVR